MFRSRDADAPWTVKRTRRRLVRIIALAAALVAGPIEARQAAASPWAEVGDAVLRSDIELLAAHGLIDGVLTTWPIPWGQVSRNLAALPRTLPPHVERSLRRVKARLARETRPREFRARGDGRITNSEALIRDFATTSREEVDARVGLEYMARSTAIRLNVGLLSDVDLSGADLVFDGTYAAQGIGNWLFYAGLIEQWWGPGWITSVALSNNARPFPKFGLMRNNPKAFETPWLSWIGPWQLNAFAGVLNDDERAVDNPVIVGLRAAFSPLRGLELGASRVLQFCGAGRDCGFGTFFEALAGLNENEPDRDPGNQQGGFDARFSAYGFGINFTLYGQITGEDEAGGLPSKSAGVLGFSLAGSVPGEQGAVWRFSAEYSDSTSGFQKASPDFNLFCNHADFPSGLRFHGRCIGPSLDNDSQLLSIVGTLTNTREWTYRVAYHHAELNRDDIAGGNTVSANEEAINIVELGLVVPLRNHTIGFELRLQDDQPNTPGSDDMQAAVEATWSVRF